MNKRPSFQFYPADWRKDSALQSCSIAAKGLWIALLCIMHECQPYGSLTTNGQPLKVSQIARLVGETEKTLLSLLNELESAGVFSRDDDGTIFSRRMRRDEHIRNVRAEAGKLGGNPALLNQKVNQMVKQEVKGVVKGGHEKLRNQKPTPSSSSSSSKNTYTLDFLAFYEEYPLKKAKARAFKAWQQLKPMNGLVEEIMSALQKHKESIDWQNNNGKFIPYPAKWLIERRWEDELQEKVKDWRG